MLSGARAQVTCRSRYTEDRLADAVRRGTGQYVMLGAGLDSFAGRSELAGRVRVFEVDHPATQDYKRRVLPDTGHVTFVPVDFGRDLFGEELRRAGFDAAAPAFVSWLGVTMYLTESAIDAALAVVGGFAAGSQIVADYMLPAGWRDAAGDSYADLVGQASADQGEPWRTMLAPEEMAARLGRHGLRLVRDVSQRDMIPAALWHRSDSLRPIELSRITLCTPQVGQRATP